MNAQDLSVKLSRLLGMPVNCSLTNNKTRLVSIKKTRAGLQINVQKLFVNAPQDVVLALASFCAKPRARYAHILRSFVTDQRKDGTGDAGGADRLLSTKGVSCDLEKIFEQINSRFFAGVCQARIGWGRRSFPKRTVRLGSYDFDGRIIRVHPILDDPEVPKEVIEDVVFHEILHWKHGLGKGIDRNVLHSPELKDEETQYPGHAYAKAWRQSFLTDLLKKYRRSVKRTG